MTPLQHIMEGHILPSADPANTRYVANVTSPALLMSQVIDMNRATFGLGVPFVQANGNIRYTLVFPEIRVVTPMGVFTRYGIGKDPTGNWLHTNVLVVASNCKSVVTSYPTKP